MKQIKLLILLVGMLAMYPSRAFANQITHTVTYDPSKLTVSYDTIEGSAYARVNYDDCVTYDTVGSPELPNDIIMLSVPYNSKNFSVNINVINYYDIQIDALIYPAQTPHVLVDTANYVFEQPNMAIYGTSELYPITKVQVISSGYLYGDNKVVSINLQPVSYIPSLNTLRLITEAYVILNYEIDNNIIPITYRSNAEIKEKEQSIIAQSVINGTSIVANAYIPNQIMQVIGHQDTLPSYEYCIITNRELEPSFKKIVAMKRQKGLSAGIICVEDLLTSPICNTGDININEMGDTISVIADSAGVVRQYLKYAFHSPTAPTQYVLMGGKSPYAPVRYTKSPHEKWPSWQHVPSDMYFSDFSIQWTHVSSNYDNINQREYLIPDLNYRSQAIPYYPDIYVGRLLCSKQEEIDNYSKKLHQYLFNPGNGDCSYLTKSMIITSEDLKYMANYINRKIGNLFDSTTYIIDTDTSYLSGSQLIDIINQNKYGYLSLYGHGEPQSIEVFNDGLYRNVISALDYYIGDTLGLTSETTINETGNGLDCLINNHHPLICYSISCVTMPYDVDPTFNVFTNYEYDYNFGESFTLGKNYGGPAYLGNTRMGYGYASEYLENEFIYSLFRRHLYSVGKAEAYSKVFYKIGSRFSNHIISEHNLLGDPEFEMWTSIPQQYIGLSLERYASSFSVNGVTPSDTIAFCDNDGNVGRIYGENGTAFLSDISHNSSIMVYNHDHIPFLFPLMLQNCDINNSQYVYTSSFFAGRNVNSNIRAGDVTIKNGVLYEVDATDDVFLDEGFIVESGATFNVKTPGKVTIDGCVFRSGARVKIESGNVEFVGKFTAERGAKVEFTQYVEE